MEIQERGKKLYKLLVIYNGQNTFTLKPVTDIKGKQIDRGVITVCGSDEEIKKFFIKKKLKDVESLPNSKRVVKYADMVLAVKAGIRKFVWVWESDWSPSNKKIDLMIGK